MWGALAGGGGGGGGGGFPQPLQNLENLETPTKGQSAGRPNLQIDPSLDPSPTTIEFAEYSTFGQSVGFLAEFLAPTAFDGHEHVCPLFRQDRAATLQRHYGRRAFQTIIVAQAFRVPKFHVPHAGGHEIGAGLGIGQGQDLRLMEEELIIGSTRCLLCIP